MYIYIYKIGDAIIKIQFSASLSVGRKKYILEIKGLISVGECEVFRGFFDFLCPYCLKIPSGQVFLWHSIRRTFNHKVPNFQPTIPRGIAENAFFVKCTFPAFFRKLK